MFFPQTTGRLPDATHAELPSRILTRVRLVPVLVLAALLFFSAGCSSEPAREIVTLTPAPTLIVRLPTQEHSAPIVTSSPTPSPTPTASPTTTATPTPATGGTIRVGYIGSPPPANPFSASAREEIAIYHLVWESLLTINPDDGSLQPTLAESWSISPDGMTLIFDLRTDVFWSDGEPFAATDVIATLRFLLERPASGPLKAGLLTVQDIRAQGDSRLLIRLTEPRCSVLYDIGAVPILPAARLSSSEIGSPPPAGTGPFLLETLENEEVVLHKNTLYREPVYPDEIVFLAFPTEEDLHAAWEDGQIDLADFPEDARINAEQRVQVLTYAGENSYSVVFNTIHPPLDNELLRQALHLGLSREGIANAVGAAGGTGLNASLLPSHWAIKGDGPSSSADLLRADELLAAAGWGDLDDDGFRSRDGERLVVNILANGENRLRVDTARMVAQGYRSLGIESEVHVVPWGLYLDALFRRDFDAVILSWPMPKDPDQRLFWHSSELDEGRGFNFAGWSDLHLDRVLEDLTFVPRCNMEKRVDLFDELNGLLRQAYPSDPLFVLHRQVWIRDEVLHIAPSPFAGLLWNAHTWVLPHQGQ